MGFHVASLQYVSGLAAGRAAISRGCTDLPGVAVHYLVTGAAGWNAFFSPVLPEADTLEARGAVVVDLA